MTETPDPHSISRTRFDPLIEGTAMEQGESFFQTLVHYLAVSLGVKTSFIGELNEERNNVRTLAAWSGKSPLPNFDYGVEDTPCKTVLDGSIQHFEDNIQDLFPNNQLLKELNARSYLAIPLTTTEDKVVGHLAAIDDKPLRADERALSIFHIFAARATAEMLHRLGDAAPLSDVAHSLHLQNERRKLKQEVAGLRESLRERGDFSELVGDSDAMWKVIHNIDVVAGTGSTVLILGETGTGKEVVARAIHRNSDRRAGPFVSLNCAAIPDSLLESELFGHVEGAFTGATHQRVGKFELASGGTIFLDEIGEMPVASQSRLLRVLQERRLEKIGGNQTVDVDVRVVAATNRNLMAMVEAGTFREDLYYRLYVFPIDNPPLRERLDDIPLLVKYFVDRMSDRLGKQVDDVDDHVFQTLMAYSWPGNVRELENVIERAMILTSGSKLELPAGVIPTRHEKQAQADALAPLASVEAAHIMAVLKHTGGIVAGPHGAAEILGLNANTLRSRMKKLGIEFTGWRIG